MCQGGSERGIETENFPLCSPIQGNDGDFCYIITPIINQSQ